MSLAVAFTGPSNSGKTTTILNVTKNLQEMGYKVAIIKHDPADKAVFDTHGKDSWKFSQTGAEVVVLSPTRTTFFSQNSKSIDEIAKMIGSFDVLIVEGLKTLDLPRIAIFRNDIDESYFKFSNAISIKQDQKKDSIPPNLDILDINNSQEIASWILKNAKKMEI